MRSLLTFMLLDAAMLRAPSQAQTVNICDRMPQVRDAILRVIGASSDCAAVESERLASLSALGLDRTQITTLQAGDFDGLISLQGLFLFYNQLTALPEGAFDSLTSLQTLGLLGNQLTALPAGVFDGLTSLQELNLTGNPRMFEPQNPAFAVLSDRVTLVLDRYRGPPIAPGTPESETPEEPEQPEEPEPPTEPETPSDDLAAKVAALETRMAALEASMATQRTALEATNATLQDISNRISALEQREPEVITSTRFIPVPKESE